MNRRKAIQTLGTVALGASIVTISADACSSCGPNRPAIRLSWDPTDPHFDEHLCANAIPRVHDHVVDKFNLIEVDERSSEFTHLVVPDMFDTIYSDPADGAPMVLDFSKCDPRKVHDFITRNKFDQ